MKNKYLLSFFQLKCCEDILEVSGSIQNRDKEITEAMAIVKQLKKIVLKEKSKRVFTIYDLCAGNALTSLISVFLLPVRKAVAIDLRERSRDWYCVERFGYRQQSIYDIDVNSIEENSIIVSVHPRSRLAEKVVNIYNNSKACHLVLMPCCIGDVTKIRPPKFIVSKIGKYLSWSWYLLSMCVGKTRMLEDKNVISPKNAIVVASKI